ncbi:hypothetical protein [Thermoplasma sp. Kam2015]|uniref:hypothetical protein n=1 Tax=Thermoplasma sp. Kam2015 TaxID=2094122 RepID=UPI00191C76EF|nr:hypothetical protein [Thermoplasma sp. Kam2015]
MEPFYFKSYDRLIGIACDEKSLLYEMKCLNQYDGAALYYHLKEGHIAMWLEYIGRKDLADAIRFSESVEGAISTLDRMIESKGMHPHRGRPKGSAGGRGKGRAKKEEPEGWSNEGGRNIE